MAVFPRSHGPFDSRGGRNEVKRQLIRHVAGFLPDLATALSSDPSTTALDRTT
jgi:hypothetical protein